MKVLLSEFLFDGRNLHKDKAVVVNNGEVIDIDNFKIIRKSYAGVEIKEFTGGVLFPGFVNTHVHLELGYLKGKIGKHKGFVNWLKSIMELKIEDENIIRSSIEAGIEELVSSGVFMVGDISNTLLSLDLLDELMPSSVVFYENYSLSRVRACDVVSELKKLKLYSKNVRISIVPHSVYSTHPCLAKFICSLDYKPFSIHFLESDLEEQFLNKKGELFEFLLDRGFVSDDFYFSDIWEFLELSSCKKRNSIFVHCVRAKSKDIEKIKKLDGTVCLCLRSNDFISSELPDVYKIADSGVNIAVGTDSLASNENLNFLDELKFIYSEFPNLHVDSIFKWSVDGGAKALGVRVGFFKGHLCKPVFIGSLYCNNPLVSILEKGGSSPLHIINA